MPTEEEVIETARQLSKQIDEHDKRTTMTERMPMADCPLHGEGSKCVLATVLSGEHKDKEVCIMVEFSDGWCICDMGDEAPMEIIHINDLRTWIRVKSVSVIGGTMFFEPL